MEVLTPGGNWSSYPPHKHGVHNPPHEVDLEEIYYYRINRPEGYAIQKVHTADGRTDATLTVRDGEMVLVPEGYHPVVAAPGYDVYYHHCAGYVETPDKIATLLDLTDPKTLRLVFDSGHYSYGAGNRDVLAGLDGFENRIWYIHLKDCSMDVAARARAEGWDYFQALRHGVFCELGQGGVDFPSLLGWLKAHGYDGYTLVEQDVEPGMGTPKDSARRNREYLRSIESHYC